MTDKFTATWVSHTSISDFLKCPRAYYLNNVYKDPATGHKVKLMNPALALGQAVHEVIESLSVLPTDQRFKEPLMLKFERAWKKITGRKGGFTNIDQEKQYRARGETMLLKVMKHPGPVGRLAVKIKKDLPYFWLSEAENIILCGKLDWLEYFPDVDGVKIIDFKTSKNEENPSSLQLLIYHLLASKCQQRQVVGAAYWYLENNIELTEKKLPKDFEKSITMILKIAKEIKLARKLNRMKCLQGDDGCRWCKPLESILSHEAVYVGINEYQQDVYFFEKKTDGNQESEVL